jgi:manganese oxidase
MLIQPIDYAWLVWFVLAGISAAYVAYDQWRNNPEPNVMGAGFVVVTGALWTFALCPRG